MPCPFSWLAALKAGYGAAGAGSEDADSRVAARLPAEDAALTGSILILVIIIVAGVVTLIRRVMRHVALIVPQPSIHAIGGEQLGMGAALDRLAA